MLKWSLCGGYRLEQGMKETAPTRGSIWMLFLVALVPSQLKWSVKLQGRPGLVVFIGVMITVVGCVTSEPISAPTAVRTAMTKVSPTPTAILHKASPTPTVMSTAEEIRPQSGAPASPISLKLTVSPFTESGRGGEAEVSATIVSARDAPEVVASWELAEGLEVLAGVPTWIGEVRVGTPVTLKLRIKASMIGDWTVASQARWNIAPDTWFGGVDAACISVAEDSIVVAKGQCPMPVVPEKGIGETTTSRP